MEPYRIIDIDFRVKQPKWSVYSVCLLRNDGQKAVHLAKDDMYMQAFLSNYILRPSCYNCQFRNIYSHSDMSIGDFWGIDKVSQGFSDEKGVSVILINTQKGNRFFNSVCKFFTLKSVSFKEAAQQPTLLYSFRKPHMRKKFFECLNNNSLDTVNERFLDKFSMVDFINWIKIVLLYSKTRTTKKMIKKFSIVERDFSKFKDSCCGCSACVQICPKNAITMKEDAEGFMYPSIDECQCIDCGLCIHSCPIVNQTRTPIIDEESRHIFAAKNKNDEIRVKSSSGGVFSVIADYVIRNGGIVFGASKEITDDGILIKHISVFDIDGLDKLRGSKYVQSDIGDSYIKTLEYLKQGKLVLFSGTGCQIAGLKSFLGRDYENLFTVDVICHGVPSQKVFRKYIDEANSKYFH